MPEALARIKKDLGPEAVIVSSYRVPGPGMKGLFVKQLEVTAALDDRPEERYFGRLTGDVKTVPGRHHPSYPTPSAGFPGAPAGDPPGPFPAGPGSMGPSGRGTTWGSRLASLEVGEECARSVLAQEQGRLEERLAQWCQAYCSPAGSSRVVVLAGPAGTGKTTTLVKLAARDVLERHEKVGVVALNYVPRPGATEFLRHWARLLDIPFAAVAEPGELERVLAGWGPLARFYLDTPADAFFKAGRLLELTGFLGRAKGAEVLLVLSATTRDADLLRAVAHARRLACAGLVLTRLDEASSLGPVLSLLPRLALPLRYLGVGREVPEDLHPAAGGLLASLLLGGGGCDTDLRAAR